MTNISSGGAPAHPIPGAWNGARTEGAPAVLVSVIIPFYKELELIERAVGSVVTQQLPPHVRAEVIIGNDSSLEESAIRAALSEASNQLTRIVKNHRDKGAGNARNAALDAAQGELIAFLDADDYWCPQKLVRQLRMIEAGANFVAGAYQFEGSMKAVTPPNRVLSTAELFKNLCVGTSTVLVRRDFLGADRFRNLRFSQDTDLWARLAGKQSFAFASTSDVVTIYAPSLRTANKLQQSLAFARLVREFRLSPSERAEIVLRYAIRGVLNHYMRR
jgi:glycosyltransferase involved in cell wall biosynthesis